MGDLVCMGGGGFSEGNFESEMDSYLLELPQKKKPKILFLPTASNNSQRYIDKFNFAFSKRRCEFLTMQLTEETKLTQQYKRTLMGADIVYVGGGNTMHMLNVWRRIGFANMILDFVGENKTVAGISAGAICWFQYGLTDSIPPDFTKLNCLGFLEGIMTPHFDSEPGRKEAFEQIIIENNIKLGYACDDGVALHFKGDKIHYVIKEVKSASAYLYTNEHDILSMTIIA